MYVPTTIRFHFLRASPPDLFSFFSFPFLFFVLSPTRKRGKGAFLGREEREKNLKKGAPNTIWAENPGGFFLFLLVGKKGQPSVFVSKT